MKGGILKLLLLSNQSNSTIPIRATISANTTILLRHLSSIPRRPAGGVRRREIRGEDDDEFEEFFLRSLNFGDDKPKHPPDRTPRGEARRDLNYGEEGGVFSESSGGNVPINGVDRLGGIPDRQPRRGRGRERPPLEESFDLGRFGAPKVEGAGRRGRGGQGTITFDDDDDEEDEEEEIAGGGDARPAASLAEKLRFGVSKGQGKKDEKILGTTGVGEGGERHELGDGGIRFKKVGGGDAPRSRHSLGEKLRVLGKVEEEIVGDEQEGCRREESSTTSEDVEAIFGRLKKTGLIPNAVAMLDGLCKDGQLQEAMKLFGLMRKTGTIPEVVVYTAVIEGFCKAGRQEDAKRVFRKMQKKGIEPNAFSYGVILRGLCRGKRWDDCLEFALEMLASDRSPNVATFAALVDAICKDKGVDEAAKMIRKLREGGLLVDEVAIRDHLDKRGPFSPLVHQAIFGTN